MSLTQVPDPIREPTIFKPVIVADSPARPAAGGRFRAWSGLLWCEWFAHSRLLLFLLTAWLAAVWTLPLFAQPDWIFLLGLVYAVLAGPAYGGGDTIEGCEEFSFALPATRSERYLARLAVGLGGLMVLTAMNFLVLGLDLSQAISRLYLDTGILKQRHLRDTPMLYVLLFALPFNVFAGAFVCSANTRSRALVLSSWLWGSLGALVLLFAGIRYEELLWSAPNGLFATPLLILTGLVVLVVGHRLFRGKEVSPEARPLQLPARWWLWTLAFLIGVTLALALGSAVLKSIPTGGVPR